MKKNKHAQGNLLTHIDKAKREILSADSLLKIEDAPSCSGVYVVYLCTRCIYVGASKNIRRRLETHSRPDLFEVETTIKVLACTNYFQVEKWLIEMLKPELNNSRYSFMEYECWRQMTPKQRRDESLELYRRFLPEPMGKRGIAILRMLENG